MHRRGRRVTTPLHCRGRRAADELSAVWKTRHYSAVSELLVNSDRYYDKMSRRETSTVISSLLSIPNFGFSLTCSPTGREWRRTNGPMESRFKESEVQRFKGSEFRENWGKRTNAEHTRFQQWKQTEDRQVVSKRIQSMGVKSYQEIQSTELLGTVKSYQEIQTNFRAWTHGASWGR